MIDLSLREAQLFRMLSSFFGRDQVIVKMSVLAVCGGELPSPLPAKLLASYTINNSLDLSLWAKKNTCLFTIIDHNDAPKMVIEFFSGFQSSIDAREEEHVRILPSLLSTSHIPYVTISDQEFRELIDPHSSLDFCTLLEHKFVEAREEFVT